MADAVVILKELGGVEDLLLDASLPNTVTQSRGGNDVELTKINADTIPVEGFYGDPSFKSINDKFSTLSTKDVVAYTIDTVDDFATVPSEYTTVIVKDSSRGGIFNAIATTTANDGTIFDGSGCSWERQYEGAVNVKWFGSDDTGTASAEETVDIAYNVAYSENTKLYFPSGTYQLHNIFGKGVEIIGDGSEKTIFIPISDDYVVSISSTDSLLAGTKLSGFSIVGNNTGTGLVLGGSGLSNLGILYNGILKDIAVNNFDKGIYVSAMLSCNLTNVNAENCITYGIEFRNEGPNTSNSFTSCRFRQNGVGVYIGSLMVASFDSCVIESNKDIGIKILSATTTTGSNIDFNTCWFENNGHTPTGNNAGTESSIWIDINSSVSATYTQNINFNNCVISSPSGIYDTYVRRARNVYFNTCFFSGLTSSNLYRVDGYGVCQVYLTNCSEYKLIPTEAMYASFPALTGGEPNFRGFKYSFVDSNGAKHTNDTYQPKVKYIDDTSVVSGMDLLGIDTLFADTSSGNIQIVSTGANKQRIGQTVAVVKTSPSNNLSFSHSAGLYGILTPTNVTTYVTNRSVVLMTFDGTSWLLNV